MTSLLQDLRYAIRMLFKRPGFAAVAILTLGLGIGANTAIFSVVHAVVFRQLPYPNSERLMQLFTQFPSMHFDKFWFSPPEFFELQSWNSSYESVAGWNNGDAAVVGDKEPVRVMASYTTGKLFETIGVGPAQGHAYADADTLPNAAPVAVLGHGLWQSGFGGDPKILGRKIQVDGVTTEIIGVMPERFDFPDRSVELWLPLTLDPAKTDNRGSHYLSVIGRLKDGMTVDQARAELGVLMAKSGELHKDQHPWSERHPIILQSLHEEIIGAVRPGMLMLLGAVGFVLLIACANVANLMLARAEARQKEIAIRKALGAGQRRLVRQLLTESLVLGLVGGLLGLAFARWGLDLILAMNPDIIPRVHEIGIDGRVLLFTLGLSLLTGFIFGLAPVVHIGVGNLHTSLKSATRGSTEGVERQGFRRALVIAEVALAVVLVVGSGLMIRSFVSLVHVEPGFNPKNLVTMELALAEANYPKDQQVVEFYNSLREKVGALPGVKGVTLMSGLPPSRRINANDIEFVGIPQPKQGEEPIWNVDYWQTVASGYFEMMGIRLIEGRLLTEADRDGAAGVVVVNETMAKRFWPGQSAVGRQLKTAPWNEKVEPQTVVGVVADVKQQGLDAPTGTEIYMTMDQMPSIAMYADRGMNLVVRSENSDPIKLVPSIRSVIRQMDPTLPVARVRTMDEVFGDAVARPWFLTVLLAAFAMVALVLAAIGIYGLLAFAVAQRTSEIGIRVALGAQRADVLRLVIGQGMILVLIGVGVGLGAAFALTRMMRSLLFGVSASDPVTFAAVPLLLIAVALVACLVPAIRALRVDPMIALRYE